MPHAVSTKVMVLGRLRRYGTQLGIRQAGFRAADALSLAPGAWLSEPDAFREGSVRGG